MAIRPGTSKDEAKRLLVTQTLTGNGSTAAVEVFGVVNAMCTTIPTGATVTFQYSWDGGGTWANVPSDASGNAVAFDDTVAAPSVVIEENEPGMQYRATASGTWTGSVTIRFSA